MLWRDFAPLTAKLPGTPHPCKPNWRSSALLASKTAILFGPIYGRDGALPTPPKNQSLNVLQYLQNSCDALASATSLSLSFDGRTLGGEDTTLCAVYNFEQDISRWAPPQVRGGTDRPFKHLPGKRE